MINSNNKRTSVATHCNRSDVNGSGAIITQNKGDVDTGCCDTDAVNLLRDWQALDRRMVHIPGGTEACGARFYHAPQKGSPLKT